MVERDYLRLMADYNRWMNERLYAVCAAIPDADRRADRGAFFGSLHATLDHILWADRRWLARLADDPPPPVALGTILFEDFAELAAARAETDARLRDWVETLDKSWLAQPLRFVSGIDGQARTRPRWLLVVHLFNHQTHHRGQATTLLSQLGHDVGSTDLPWLSGGPGDASPPV